jgi:HK97 family phage prohead protease
MSLKIDLGFDSERCADGDARRSYANGREVTELPALQVRAIDVEKREVRVLASSPTLDRHGEIILPSAFQDTISRFMANPCVLGCHQHRLADGEPPVIGSVVKLWIDKAGLWAVIRFAETELGESYWVLYRDGHMRAVSVGFVALQWEDKRDEDGGYVRTYTRVELLEISCVAVPSNPDALVKESGNRNAWLDQKREAREEKKIMAEIYAENPDFDAESEEFCWMLLTGDCVEDLELSDSDEEDDKDLNFAQLVKAGACSDQPVAALPRKCGQAANTFFEDAGSPYLTFRIGERDRLAPHSKTEFENPFYRG